MSPMPNWSDFFRAYSHDLPEYSPYATSMKGNAMPIFMQPVVLIRRPSRSFISYSLMWFCSSPEPGTNYGMHLHDHLALNGTVRGYAIVSRTQKTTTFRNHRHLFLANPRTGVRAPTSTTGAHSHPAPCSLVANAGSVAAGKVVDPL